MKLNDIETPQTQRKDLEELNDRLDEEEKDENTDDLENFYKD